jgi:hypothetical protein
VFVCSGVTVAGNLASKARLDGDKIEGHGRGRQVTWHGFTYYIYLLWPRIMHSLSLACCAAPVQGTQEVRRRGES